MRTPALPSQYSWLKSTLKSTYFQQIAPLVVLIILPAFFLLFARYFRRAFAASVESLRMGLESLGVGSFGFAWPWSALNSGSSSASADKARNKERSKDKGKAVQLNGHANANGRGHKRKSSSASASASSLKSKNVMTRAEQIAMNGLGKSSKTYKQDEKETDEPIYYAGLVNISGTYCFMNSTLQAMASLTYLQPHIDAIHAKAEALDVPTPVIDALQELFHKLNTPKSTYYSIRPQGIINALSNPSSPFSFPSYKPKTSSTLFNSREHQDAQELFQLVTECIKNEMSAVEREGIRDRGIAGVLDLAPSGPGAASSPDASLEAFSAGGSKSVFDGLTANRRSCVVCGYTEAVMHFGFDNWQLAVPPLATSCRLEDCLEEYTRLEILKDCICRKCSVLATQTRILNEIKSLKDSMNDFAQNSNIIEPSYISNYVSSSSSTSHFSSLASSSFMPSSSTTQKNKHKSSSLKKRLKELRRMEQTVQTALSQGRIEDDTLLEGEGVKLEKVVSLASTKQAMIARPPPVLALHLNRSVHYGQYAAKNTIKVYFPEVLDLTPYTTSGSLSTVPTNSISSPSPPINFGSLSVPNRAISSPSPPLSPPISNPIIKSSKSDAQSQSNDPHRPERSTTPTQQTYTHPHSLYAPGSQRVIYRLAAVVCHYGQHSFGHYVCFRRKPKNGAGQGVWMEPRLVDPVRVEMEHEMQMEEARELEKQQQQQPNGSASHSTSKPSKSSSKIHTSPLNYLFHPHLSYAGSSTLGEVRYYWEDKTEAEAGTGRGWLRLSDDSVSEVGIESVLAEGSGAFMLYYERAVHPKPNPSSRGRADECGLNGDLKACRRGSSRSRTRLPKGSADIDVDLDVGDIDADGDAFSVDSEETLKPKMKVVDLNGSIGSLITEVGVGVMDTSKKGKEKLKDKDKEKEMRELKKDLSLSMVVLPASGSGIDSHSSGYGLGRFGPRIVRSVNARKRTPSVPPSVSDSAASRLSTPDDVTEHVTSSSSSSASSSFSPSLTSLSTSATSVSIKTNGSESHGDSSPRLSPSPSSTISTSTLVEGHALSEEDFEYNEQILADMTASAPSILSTPAASLSPRLNDSAEMGLGSKSTKVLHHHGHFNQQRVKAR